MSLLNIGYTFNLDFFQDKDFHFPEVLVQAAKMLVENSGWQRAMQLEEEMRKNSLVHMAISTAKTILYYTPIIFLTRFLLYTTIHNSFPIWWPIYMAHL